MTRMISNSETSTWLQCTRKYYYEYVLNLEPKQMSDAIGRGVLIHAMLEGYYAAKATNRSEEECREEAMEPLIFTAASGGDIAELGATRDLVMGYFDRYELEDERYEVAAVETKYVAELSKEFSLVGTLDLLLKDKEDGRLVAVDHKSTYNFWTEDQATISGQFVKYIIILRTLGMDVKSLMVNQLRTRPVKNGDLYRRIWVNPSDKRIAAVLRQHVLASKQIVSFRDSGAKKEDTVPIYDKYICSNCPFLTLCDSDTEGVDISYQIEQNYQKRTTYGYNEELLK